MLEKIIYLTIVLLPIYLVSFPVFGLPTNLLEILIGVGAVAWYLGKKPKEFIKNFLLQYKEISFGFFLIGIGLLSAILAGGNYSAGLGIFKGWFFLPLLFAFMAKDVLDNPEKKEKALQDFFWSAFFVALISLAYYANGNIRYDGRLEAIFNSPNYLAMYLAPAILTGIINYEARITNKKISVKIAGLLVILAVFYLTYSYAAWLAAALSLAITFFLKEGKKINIKKIVIFLAIMGVLILSQLNNDKLKKLSSFSESSSLASRAMIWKSAGKIIGDNPIFGIGPGNFQEKYLEYQRYFPPYLEWAVPHPHNTFLAFWLYGGFLGLVGLLMIIYYWGINFFRKEKTTHQYALAAIIIYFLLHGLVDTTYFKNDLSIIFWLSILLSL